MLEQVIYTDYHFFKVNEGDNNLKLGVFISLFNSLKLI
jgi:hypothetical protein